MGSSIAFEKEMTAARDAGGILAAYNLAESLPATTTAPAVAAPAAFRTADPSPSTHLTDPLSPPGVVLCDGSDFPPAGGSLGAPAGARTKLTPPSARVRRTKPSLSTTCDCSSGSPPPSCEPPLNGGIGRMVRPSSRKERADEPVPLGRPQSACRLRSTVPITSFESQKGLFCSNKNWCCWTD